MKNNYLPVFFIFLSGIFLVSCSTSSKEFSYTKGGEIWFRNSDIKLRINTDMALSVYYRDGTVPLNVAQKGGLTKPGHFIVVDGKPVIDFPVDYERISVEDVTTVFGKGRKLTLTGTAVLTGDQRIEKTMYIECYEAFSDAALISTSYKNTGTSEVKIDQAVSNYFRLDASQTNRQHQPYDYWSYQGASIGWGLDYVIQLKEGFKQDNWMGVQPDTKTGGGVPFVDLWNEKAGLAIAHIEPKPQLVSFPVEVTADKTVEMSMRQDINKRLAPGESLQTIQSVVIAHVLDYFDPLQTYSALMAAQGVKQKQPSDEAHEAIWCGWGYLTDFTLDDIYGTLPKLKELGIKWIDLDDRWWDKYGDWNVRAYTFPGGGNQMKLFVDSLHKQGFKVRVWWAPTPVQPETIPTWGGSVDPGMAQTAKDHPDWLVMDENGDYPRDCREMYQFCPSVPEVQEYMKTLTTRFIGEWGFDGHKLDAYYVVPPCYNPAHHHQSPEESYQDLPKLLKIIYETSKALKPYSVTEVCNCGTPQDFYQSVYTDQPVTSDPTSVLQSRRRVKSMKALWGANAPVFTDHVEHIRPDVDMNDKSNTATVGQDFATSMGPGGVIGTKFTWPAGPENMQLTGEREKHWKKWVKLYHEKMLSKGDYLNRYDIIYDKPESHVVQKGSNFYYAFYAKEWQGEIELRGLENKKYKVHDYVNDVDLGTVIGPTGKITPAFKEHLLIECIPELSLTCCETKTTTDMQGGEWKVIGPGGGGGIMKPTISPFDENFVLYHCDMTAAYISLDGGDSWNMKNLWNVPEDFEFDPVDPNTIYVATRGFSYSEDRGSGFSMLYRSTDKGERWEIVFPDVKKAKKRFEKLQSYDLKPSDVIEGAIDGNIDKIAVDLSNNQNLYLGLSPLKDYMSAGSREQNIDSAMLVRSDDKGRTWTLICRLPGESVRAVFPPGKTGLRDEVLVFTERGSVRINERTKQVMQVDLPVNRLIAVEGGKGRIYIQSPMRNVDGKITGGMFISKDNGKSWTQINNGLMNTMTEGRVLSFRTGLAVCESQPDVAYISFTSPEKNEKGTVDQVYSVYKTSNAGADWKPVLRSSSGGYLTNNYEGSWLDKSYGPGWGGAPIDLGTAPGNPDICYAGDNGRGYKTLDGGKTWKQVYSHEQPDGSFTSSGLDVTTCYGVHFDPFDKDHYFICYTDMGLFHTFNGGKSWFHSLTGVPNAWVNTCYQVGFDPKVKGRVWSVWANAHDLPRTKMFSPRGFGNYQGGVTVSDDSGKTWTKSNNGMPENAICTNILLDPSSPVNARILYVSVFDKGVYKSADGGNNWEVANQGLGENLLAWQMRRNAKGRLFVVCARGLKEGNTVDGEVYYSDDKAVTWNKLALPEGVNGPHDLLIDPKNTKRMYLSCWPRKTDEGDANGGVYKTEDGGETWRQVFDPRFRVNAADLDPAKNNILYINTFQNAAYRSADFGETWKRVEGYRFKWGQRPAPDPHHPGMLFLTTYGGSVFYGPSEGIPGVFEGITNMPEGWW